MNGFDIARGVEAEGFMRLRPFLEDSADGNSIVVTNKGRMAPFLQEVVGDVIMNRRGLVWSIELKTERRHTGNLFLETWSNRNLDDPHNHAMVGSNPGWLLKSRADLFMYYFLDADALYVLSGLALQRWAFGFGGVEGRIYSYPEVKQGKYIQANDTYGRLAPIAVLMREMKPPPKKLSVRQLSLDLRGAAA